ncbi:MAG: hypothetical protein CO113_18880 [Elusimicrobia bacterium CG_4_9_14_3_um_filter_62_55]|nr:MAG: hypothetical protein CO113_18880 [Elusimicrobia bacterium CG_4_9_14_3_um_filter_62_55]
MRKTLLASLLSLALVGQAGATPWHDLGPRAMAMGGAGVAMAQGPLASYWNPAGLGQLYGTSGLVIPAFGMRIEATGRMLEGANDLYQISQNAASHTNADVTNALTKFGERGNGAMVDLGASVALKLWKGTIFATPLAYIGATPYADTTGGLTPATLGTANTSEMRLRGGVFTELGFGYAHEIMETGLIVGGNLKGIVGKVGFNRIRITQTDPGNGSFGDFDTNTKTSIQPGVDLGLLWDMRETFDGLPLRPRIGVVGRNLNNPKFKYPAQAVTAGERDKLSMQGQVRAGVALSPFKFWHLTADLDMTENLTLIDGYKTRYAGVGTEINVVNRPRFNLPLRAGLKKNLSDTNSGVAFTAGAGLNFFHFTLDIAGQVSAKRTQLQSEGKNEKVPNNVAASIRLGFLFGQKDEGGRE